MVKFQNDLSALGKGQRAMGGKMSFQWKKKKSIAKRKEKPKKITIFKQGYILRVALTVPNTKSIQIRKETKHEENKLKEKIFANNKCKDKHKFNESKHSFEL